MVYTVNQLAKLAGVSVRTLHYYDEIGLLEPSYVMKNGYRAYEDKEVLRLQQILFFRELDFPLEDIKRIMDAPHFNRLEALRDQKRLLEKKRRRMDGLVRTITKTIKSMTNNTKTSDEELYDVLKDDDVKEYQEEVKERWGNSEAYRQSMAKASNMTKAEMEKLKEDGKKHTQAIADAMNKGFDHPEVQTLIAKSHEGVNFFYDCSLEMFRKLGEMYVADPRFAAYYEKFRPGLAQFMREAIDYYCDHQE